MEVSLPCRRRGTVRLELNKRESHLTFLSFLDESLGGFFLL